MKISTIVLLSFVALVLPAAAQFELKGGTFNSLRTVPVDTSATGGDPVVVTPQYAGVGSTAASSGPVSDSSDPQQRYPAGLRRNASEVVIGGMILVRSSVGGVFASGVPRYFMGDEIRPPELTSAGDPTSDPNYWRSRPVEYGEVITQPGSSQVIPLENPNAPDDPPAYSYYYSPHADRVFAHQPGQVKITWVTQAPVNETTGLPDPNGVFRFKEEIFNVSSSSSREVRVIYWTERTFGGPGVPVPTGTVTTVKPAFNLFFPETLGEEYVGVGTVPPDPGASPSPEKRTLWLDNQGGSASLRAYNIEGRVLIEYLGEFTNEAAKVHEFLGADIVEVKQVARSVTATVELGEEILPHVRQDQPAEDPGRFNAVAVRTAPIGDFTGTSQDAAGRTIYHAEKENLRPDNVAFYWLENEVPEIPAGDLAEPVDFGIEWPKLLNRYLQVWPESLSEYAGVTVNDAGAGNDTGVRFEGGALPELVFQDDPAQLEARINIGTQRLLVDFSGSPDRTNRSLIKFSNQGEVWYERLYIQSWSVVTPPAQVGNPAFATLADRDADGVSDLIDDTAVVGSRIEPPPGTVTGYVASGTHYSPGAYIDPFVEGIAGAMEGAIIPVNAPPGNELVVWWFSEVGREGFESFHVPSLSGRYEVSWPQDAGRIVLASNRGGGLLTSAQKAGSIYYENDSSRIGYNPNEEHALLLNGTAWALRDNINVTSGEDYTSEPFVLLSYVDPADERPAMRVFEVVQEDVAEGEIFTYPVTAGSPVPAPMPLPLLPLPADADGQVLNTEYFDSSGSGFVPDNAPSQTAPDFYDSFTYQDRKGFTWVYRGPHQDSGPTPNFGMRFYYPMLPGFHVPGRVFEEGDPLPYLGDPRLIGSGQAGQFPRTVFYEPEWPQATPQLLVAETLTLPKFGLPQVRGQSSVEILYQQSVATLGSSARSAELHDPTRAKTVRLGDHGLDDLPPGIATSIRNGKTYFQRLPPHLKERFYMTPALGGDLELILLGEFVDEIAGEDYLHLNVLSAGDRETLLGLAENAEAADQANWTSAIDALSTALETFVENPVKKGTYKATPASPANAAADELAEIHDSDTAVDSYALTATGKGTGFVSLIFADGEAFTPAGDPISVAVIQVAPRLYVGDLKVLLSDNPLDEQVNLRHSGDFAGKPEDYEFEWRYHAGSEIPDIYDFDPPSAVTNLSTLWEVFRNPGFFLPLAGSTPEGQVTLPASLEIKDENFTGGISGDLPGILLRTTLDFTAGVPDSVIFSADLGSEFDGFLLSVNNQSVFEYRGAEVAEALEPRADLSETTGLPLQFELPSNRFSEGINSLTLSLYSDADGEVLSEFNFKVEQRTRTDNVEGASEWLKPTGDFINLITVGGSPSAPLGSPLLVMADNVFTMRYRPKVGTGNVMAPDTDQAAVPWSDWMPPKLVPGWIKRVLGGINPFNQRVTDLYSNAVSTDTSVLTQAGTRWEGDIALNLDNINDVGLIEIYETVLNRAKLFSIDNGQTSEAVNDALLLAAGYLNDLYILVGNEAFADAANPTISLDGQDELTSVSTSRFSFEGQVSSLLEEELALLRGRDDSLGTSIRIQPFYNRLVWNYTGGIDSGQTVYAVNYNIKEKVGSDTADGIVDAADAQRMFPQGHGDAYGHYLTAVKGYYKLLTNDVFDWVPRSETVLVAGQNVSVDYFDERKFAAAAGRLAETVAQVLELTYRQSYSDDPAAGWSHFSDTDESGVGRGWGVDGWATRATQGSYFHWVVGNALLPDEDPDETHSGIEIIDRRTVPELSRLAVAGGDFQTTLDNANARLNPLGLSPDAIAFDISPVDLKAGESHFEQVYGRALAAVLNAKGAFDQAGGMTRLLRQQTNTVDEQNNLIEQQERAFNYQLIDLLGSPYDGDTGPGKTYVQGYEGPDYFNWFYIDRATDIVDTGETVEAEVEFPLEFSDQLTSEGLPILSDSVSKTVSVVPNRLVQDAADPDGLFAGNPGQRRVTGEMQAALIESQRAQMALLDAIETVQRHKARFDKMGVLFEDLVTYQDRVLAKRQLDTATITARTKLQKRQEAIAQGLSLAGDTAISAGEAVAEYFPTTLGLASDTTFAGRAVALTVGTAVAARLRIGSAVAFGNAGQTAAEIVQRQMMLETELDRLGFDYEQKQFIFEYELLAEELEDSVFDVSLKAIDFQRANEKVRNVLARADRILAEREIYRIRAASVIQGYRTNDVAFRTFRNEALEQYRTLFDLGARYTYLAAKSYDYETGLLGSAAGQEVLNRIVASRSLGDLTGGQPQATTSTLGDPGLAGTMAQLVADFSVAEGRLGINNPDQNGTLFSLRHELFRLLDDPNITADDDAWQQTLEQYIVSDLRNDPDVIANCRNISKPDGSAVPGIVIPFGSTIQHGYNWFGLPLAGGDHNYSPSNFATKIYSAGMVLEGYVGMDPYAIGTPQAGEPNTTSGDSLAATPYVYLIPAGTDHMLAPPLGDTNTLRTWKVADQALPLPYNLGASDFNSGQFFEANGTLSEEPWIQRKHQAFRPVNDPAFFFSRVPQEFTSSRLIGRSVWNSEWKIVIPAYTLLNDEEEGLERFVRSVDDIKLFLRTYSNSGN